MSYTQCMQVIRDTYTTNFEEHNISILLEYKYEI